jgi:hypothetical protein
VVAGWAHWVGNWVAFNPDGQERGIPTGLAASFYSMSLKKSSLDDD